MDEETLRATMRRRATLGRAMVGLVTVGGVAAVLGLGAMAVRAADPPSMPEPAMLPPSPEEPEAETPSVSHAGYSPGARARRRAVFAAAGDDSAFVRKPPPEAGDWLAHFREPGQTVAEHARDCANRRTAERHTLHLLPYGDLSPVQRALLPDLKRFVSVYFGVRAEVLPEGTPPKSAWSAQRGQWNAEALVRAQRAVVPTDSLGVLGLLGGDLYAADLNFVFGIGMFADRVGVHSLHRFGRHAGRLARRAFALAAHELGHMFGLEHCVFYACVMNGTNSVDETDRAPLHLCPVCRAKLQHAIGFEHPARYRALASFYTERGMSAEAAFCAAQAEAMASTDPESELTPRRRPARPR